METRSVYAMLLPETVEGTQPKIVRFLGETFHDLRLRLLEAHLPGVTAESFIELKLDDGTYVCLLEDEELPAGDLHVAVHNFPKEFAFRKPAPWQRGFRPHRHGPPRGPYFYDEGFPPPHLQGHHHHHGRHGGPHPHRMREHWNAGHTEWELLDSAPGDERSRCQKHKGGWRRHSPSRSRSRSHSRGRRSHSPRGRHGDKRKKKHHHHHKKGKTSACCPRHGPPTCEYGGVGPPTGEYRGIGPPNFPGHMHEPPPPPVAFSVPPWLRAAPRPPQDVAGPSNMAGGRDSGAEAFVDVAEGLDVLEITDGSPSSGSSTSSSSTSSSDDSRK